MSVPAKARYDYHRNVYSIFVNEIALAVLIVKETKVSSPEIPFHFQYKQVKVTRIVITDNALTGEDTFQRLSVLLF